MQAGTAVGNLASAIGFRTEDAALVADLKAGSEEAFALLIAQYHQPLYSLIARSLNDPADAADITQDVFLKVFRSIRSSTVIPPCGPGSTALHFTRRPINAAGGAATSARKPPSTRLHSPTMTTRPPSPAFSPTRVAPHTSTPYKRNSAPAWKTHCASFRRSTAPSLFCEKLRGSPTRRSQTSCSSTSALSRAVSRAAAARFALSLRSTLPRRRSPRSSPDQP